MQETHRDWSRCTRFNERTNEKYGYTSFVYAPVGFVAEHLEVLYDNDFECKVVTDEIGAKYYRPEMPNASDAFIDCLTDVVVKKKNL